MRGWITGGHATCAREGAADDALELVQRPVEVVVDDRVLELRLERELLLRDLEPLVDLALALGRPRPEPFLELFPARGGHEDRHRSWHAVAHGQRAAGLDLEHRRVAVGRDAVELGPERSRAVALTPGKRDPLEEAALLQLPVELPVAQEPVVAAVLLARPTGSRRRRDGERQLRDTLDQPLRQRALALAAGAGDDEDRSLSTAHFRR